MSADSNRLPIYAVADAVLKGLEREGRVVLSAPTGSGKSTQLPQILLDSGQIDGEIVVLQPRRLAARLLAQRVAKERTSTLGEEVGYQIRFENRTSRQTRIRFVTEAVLLRQILSNPSLPGVGAILFDEFHERNISSDLSLAAVLDRVLPQRPDIKVVVMSATLEVDTIEDYLSPCARVEAEGRLYPVDIEYTGPALGRQSAPVWERARAALKRQLQAGFEGNCLIFMPGAYEINQTLREIESLPEARDFAAFPLYGELSIEAQNRAVEYRDRAKIVVATNVAETSITIDGVTLVIDGGLAKIARYEALRGVNSLTLMGISQAAAKQRAGRAGRTSAGRCLRLWSEAEHMNRPANELAEIHRIDLSETLMMLAAAGIDYANSFPWFEVPEADALLQAESLLQILGAYDADKQLTEIGRRMSRFPMHPRFSRMMIEADRLGVLQEVAEIAALNQGRPIYRVSKDSYKRREQIRVIEETAAGDSDLFVQLRALEYAVDRRFKHADCAAVDIHAVGARQCQQAAQQFLAIARQNGLQAEYGNTDTVAVNRAICQTLLVGFSDYLCVRMDAGTRRCRTMSGKVGELVRESVVESALFIASNLSERIYRGELNLVISMASAIELSWLHAYFPDDFCVSVETVYDTKNRRVVARKEQRFRSLMLECSDSDEVDLGVAAELLAEAVVSGQLKLKQWNQEVENWIQRVNFVATHCPETEIALIDAEARLLMIEQVCEGAVSYKEIKDRACLPIVQEWISPEQSYYLDAYAPAEMELPRRKRPVKIRYEADGRAFIASKLQDFYDVPGSSLRIANGEVALLVELLAPNGRPAHLTDNIDAFWEGAYVHVRKELAGRYPKHEWR